MFPKLHLIWADAAYAGSLVDWVKHFIGCGIIIVKRCDSEALLRSADPIDGFKVLPRALGRRADTGMAWSLSPIE